MGSEAGARSAGDDGDAERGREVLRADVETFPLADALGAIHGAGLTGRLSFRYEEHCKAVWLKRGEVVFAISNQEADRLGDCLVRAGGLRLSQLRDAERHFRPPARFGKVLVQRGYLTPRELWNGVRHQVEEIVRSLFAYPGGEVRFATHAGEPENVVRLALETSRLVSEGLRRRAELQRFLEVLDDPRVRLVAGERFQGDLAGAEQAFADALGAGAHFDDVRVQLGLSRESAARSVQLLRLVGAVKLDHSLTYDGAERGPDLVGVARRGADRVHGLVAALAAAEGGRARVQERLAQVLDDVTAHFPALLTGLSLGAAGELDPSVLSERARQVPGDAAAMLGEALSELVSYLEFEVKNHPAISQPERVLAQLPGAREARG